MMTLLSPLLLLRANSPTTMIKSRRSLLLLRALKRDVMRFENEEKRSNDGDEFKKKCTKKVPLKRPRVRAHTPMILLRFGTENKTEAGSCANTRAHTTIQKNTFNDAWRFFWTRNAKK